MIKLLSLGVLSGAFFSSTFVLNEMMSMEGGHWLWSASLRYVFMLIFLTGILFFQGGIRQLRDVFKMFFSYWKFWIVAGGVGFGGFYALICFSADYSPGWVVAATWQFTVVASLFVFMLFGRSFPRRVWLFSTLVFGGVVLVNFSNVAGADYYTVLYGGLPVLGAAFCYPFGNQLVWEAKNGNNTKSPKIDSLLLDNVFNKIFLMTLGSLPLWLVLVVIVQPPAPEVNQVLNSSLVALLSGIIATGIFLFARNLARNSSELAAVDATQASEVVFAVLGGVVLLHSKVPDLLAMSGLVLILAGLLLFVWFQKHDE